MDPTLNSQARRLYTATALAAHAAKRSAKGRVTPDATAGDLLALARRLGEGAEYLERRYRLSLIPSYPGVTGGVEGVASGGLRLVLACTAGEHDDDSLPFGVVFTALIPGRPPRVSVAPVGAHVPAGWRPLADFLP